MEVQIDGFSIDADGMQYDDDDDDDDDDE